MKSQKYKFFDPIQKKTAKHLCLTVLNFDLIENLYFRSITFPD